VGAFAHPLRGLARDAQRYFTHWLLLFAHLHYYQSYSFGMVNAAAERYGQYVE
jgi:hypothetical protein